MLIITEEVLFGPPSLFGNKKSLLDSYVFEKSFLSVPFNSDHVYITLSNLSVWHNIPNLCTNVKNLDFIVYYLLKEAQILYIVT